MIAAIVKWSIVAFYVLATLGTIASIGKPRKPTDPSTATGIVALNTLVIVAIVIWWQP